MRRSLAAPHPRSRMEIIARGSVIDHHVGGRFKEFREAVDVAIEKQSLRQLSARMQAFNEAAAAVDETDLNIIDEI